MGHTPRNLTLFAHLPPTAAASGAEAVPLGSVYANPGKQKIAHIFAKIHAIYTFFCENRMFMQTTQDPATLLRFVPSPRPSLRGKGARGHVSAAAGNRCGGTGASPIVPPSSAGQTPTAPPTGRARHTRRGATASRIHHSRTGGGAGGGRGDARGCGVWGWRVGRVPAVRAAREAAGGARPPGGYPRVSSSGRVPSCLTSSRRCGNMLHEGSHRRRSQRRPSSMVRQKPGRFRNDRALLYPVTPRTRPFAASNAPNATKPLFILLRSQDPNKYCPLLPWSGLLMRFPIWQWVRVLHRILSNA